MTNVFIFNNLRVPQLEQQHVGEIGGSGGGGAAGASRFLGVDRGAPRAPGPLGGHGLLEAQTTLFLISVVRHAV
jgi:hypothetical protein